MELREVSLCAQLACALEVACLKPGNVNRYYDFEDTKLEHYLASAVAIGRSASKAAKAGFKHGTEKASYHKIGIGRLILEAVRESRTWHTGRNTNLGMALLLLPLCASYGAALSRTSQPSETEVREKLDLIMRSTTSEDSVNFYRAVRIANPGGLGEYDELDVMEANSIDRIIREGINLYQIMLISVNDSLAKELTNRMRITFEIGYPAIHGEYQRARDLTASILYGYMSILSEVPDSLIARKKGSEVARKISWEAKGILRAGLPQDKIKEFDRKLRTRDNALNPGATADLTTSSLMVCLLMGVRP